LKALSEGISQKLCKDSLDNEQHSTHPRKLDIAHQVKHQKDQRLAHLLVTTKLYKYEIGWGSLLVQTKKISPFGAFEVTEVRNCGDM
jgi:hypothetical protein